MDVRVIRSEKRQRTISGRMEQGVLVVRLPAGMSEADEAQWVARMRDRVLARQRTANLNADEALRRRADELNRQYFGGTLRIADIRYVANMERRWGSCSTGQATIRLSDRLANVPGWVRDYVIIHELAHLVRADHSPAFWKLVTRFRLTERARGYLIALGYAEAAEDGGADAVEE